MAVNQKNAAGTWKKPLRVLQ